MPRTSTRPLLALLDQPVSAGRRRALVVLALIWVGTAPASAAAESCGGDRVVWSVDTIVPDHFLNEGEPVIIRGRLRMPVDIEAVAESLRVRVTYSDGVELHEPVVAAALGSDLLWWPTRAGSGHGPLEWSLEVRPGAVFADRLLPSPRRPDRLHFDRFSHEPPPPARTIAQRIDVRERTLPGPCEAMTRCGVCEQSMRLSRAPVWQVAFEVEVPDGDYAKARYRRIALGPTAREARTMLRATPYAPLKRAGRVDLTADGGPRSDWPGDSACAALQIVDPVEGLLLDETRCFDLIAGHVHFVPPEPEPGSSIHGCAVGSPGHGPGGWLLGVMLGAVSWRRRRHPSAGCCARGVGPLALGAALLTVAGPADASSWQPPPLLGGTLAIHGDIAVVGDPDRARVVVADIARGRILAEHAADRPWRVALDDDRRRAYVTLRGEGALLVIDIRTGAELQRAPVCAAPRGVTVAWQAVHVACAGGALVTLNDDGERLQIVRRLPLEPDLRDVVFADEALHVSRFRSTTLISVNHKGKVLARRTPRVHTPERSRRPSAPTVAWRTVARPNGWVLMLHQRARIGPPRAADVNTTVGAYGASRSTRGIRCGGGAMVTEITAFPPLGKRDPRPRLVAIVPEAVVPLDLLADGAEGRLALAAPGNARDVGWGSSWLAVNPDDSGRWPRCALADDEAEDDPTDAATPDRPRHTALAMYRGVLVGLERDRPVLSTPDGIVYIDLSGPEVRDRGRALFHTDAGLRIACASCHPEASHDGHVWWIEGPGPRRTQELRGGIGDSAPFHWAGELPTFQHLLDEVMTRRMGGAPLSTHDGGALLRWIDAQTAAPTDSIAGGDPVSGATVFADPAVGCATCHSGPRLTDGALHDVGTGGLFETPTLLGVGRRAPLMHDGCATTLAERFDPDCGGGEAHGHTAHLSVSALRDLTAYLANL